jgi:hypothetical protein
MYHEVLVPKKRQSLFRFLWKNAGDAGEPKEYKLQFMSLVPYRLQSAASTRYEKQQKIFAAASPT